MQPILYSFRRCPYAIRARIALHYSDIKIQHREVVLKNKPKSMIDFSSKATVPVLVLNDGTVIDESSEIIRWALDQRDEDNWRLLADNKECKSDREQSSLGKEIQSLIDYNDHQFKPLLDRYKYHDRYPEENKAYYRTQAEEFLKALENRLQISTYLFAEDISVADISILPFIRQFAFVDKPWFDQSNYNNVQSWLDNFLASKLFNAVMDKHIPWVE